MLVIMVIWTGLLKLGRSQNEEREEEIKNGDERNNKWEAIKKRNKTTGEKIKIQLLSEIISGKWPPLRKSIKKERIKKKANFIIAQNLRIRIGCFWPSKCSSWRLRASSRVDQWQSVSWSEKHNWPEFCCFRGQTVLATLTLMAAQYGWHQHYSLQQETITKWQTESTLSLGALKICGLEQGFIQRIWKELRSCSFSDHCLIGSVYSYKNFCIATYFLKFIYASKALSN